MPSNLVDRLTNDNYKILKLLYENQVNMNDGSVFTPMTQVEIAQKIGVSKITINNLFKELKKDGLVYPYGLCRGRYCLSDKALLIINQIEILYDQLK